jgi:uncharacterized OsmC-like protein
MEVKVDYIGGMGFHAQCGSHKVAIDLPEESGGKDKAATPPQLFLASLGSCVGVYVASYCQNSGLDAREMQISVSAHKAADPARLDDIKITISLPKAELGKRAAAVLQVAKKCLIHNTIGHNSKMEIELAQKQ